MMYRKIYKGIELRKAHFLDKRIQNELQNCYHFKSSLKMSVLKHGILISAKNRTVN